MENLAPSDSFIAVDDFKSAAELADYLKYLMEHSDEYLRYFEWKKTQKVHIGPWKVHVGKTLN